MPASSNMFTLSLPKTGRSLSSARMTRLSLGSCRFWALTYSHSFLTTSVRATVPSPMTAARAALGCSVPAAGLRAVLVAVLVAVFAVVLAAAFLAGAFLAGALLAAAVLRDRKGTPLNSRHL